MKHKQKMTAILMAAALAVVIAIPAFAANILTIDVEPGVTVYVNDMPIDSGDTHGNPEAFIYNGTTYIAAAAVSKSLGENVKWDGSTRSVYIGKHVGSSYFLLDVCPPYDTDAAYKEYSAVTMAGRDYFRGFGFGNGGSALFNLSGKYDTLSFDLGHIDGGDSHNETFSIYLDGELAFSAKAEFEDMPRHYEVPLNGALQMKIESKESGMFISYALANVRVS